MKLTFQLSTLNYGFLISLSTVNTAKHSNQNTLTLTEKFRPSFNGYFKLHIVPNPLRFVAHIYIEYTLETETEKVKSLILIFLTFNYNWNVLENK